MKPIHIRAVYSFSEKEFQAIGAPKTCLEAQRLLQIPTELLGVSLGKVEIVRLSVPVSGKDWHVEAVYFEREGE